ncbi:MAG: anaerobic ribonucleoside-triphosphate reductase activating protein [Alphaproteobacteria bacterium]|nr:anaerobic ribonucleoside-triphosphate reductase activating protein [Alphaproteobacteria bacterium]
MKVAGLVPFTTIDFPNRLAGVVFFQGCPLKCPYCHNPNLQDFNQTGTLSWNEVISFFSERKKRLDGVVLSGGEPLMQSDILKAVQDIKGLGFQVAIHTSGIYPQKIKEILPFIDWVGLDVKAPKEKYHLLSGREKISSLVFETLKILSDSDIDFEVRTTLDPKHLTIEDIYLLASQLKEYRIPQFALQKYRTFPGDTNPPSQSEIDSFFENNELIQTLQNDFNRLVLR